MEYGSLNIEKVHIVRIDPGEDVLQALRKFLAESGLTQAVVLGGYGTLTTYHIHWVGHTRIPTRVLYGEGEGGIEILAMNGLVVDGKPHIHITLSSTVGAFGGHLEEGCTAYVLCEIYFGEVSGPKLSYKRVPVNVEGMGAGEVNRLQFNK